MTKETALKMIREYMAEECVSAEWVECLNLCRAALIGNRENSILHDAVDYYGKDAQLVIAVEEMSELIKELCKDKRGIGVPEHIAEEMADVSIILQELLLIYGNEKEVENWQRRKLERLEERLHDNA